MNLQLHVSKDRLDRTLGLLKHALDRRVTLPILQHILVDVRPKEVILKATDMELAFEATVPGEGQGQWTMAVPGKKFIETVRVFPEGILSLECPDAGSRLWLRAKGMNSEHNIQPGEGFPELPSPGKDLLVVKIPVLRFKRAIQLGSIAVSKDATKPTLSAVLVHLSKHHVRVVSTDGFRLAVAEVPCDTKLKDEVRLIVPKGAIESGGSGAVVYAGGQNINRELANRGLAKLDMEDAGAEAQAQVAELLKAPASGDDAPALPSQLLLKRTSQAGIDPLGALSYAAAGSVNSRPGPLISRPWFPAYTVSSILTRIRRSGVERPLTIITRCPSRSASASRTSRVDASSCA